MWSDSNTKMNQTNLKLLIEDFEEQMIEDANIDKRMVSSPNKELGCATTPWHEAVQTMGEFRSKGAQLIADVAPQNKGISASRTSAEFTKFTAQTCRFTSQKPWHIQQLFPCRIPVENL